jgi:hypothetical protein
MSLAIRHDFTGEEVLQMEAGAVLPTGWDLMVRLAAQLGLETPYQITLYSNRTNCLARRTQDLHLIICSRSDCQNSSHSLSIRY